MAVLEQNRWFRDITFCNTLKGIKIKNQNKTLILVSELRSKIATTLGPQEKPFLKLESSFACYFNLTKRSSSSCITVFIGYGAV